MRRLDALSRPCRCMSSARFIELAISPLTCFPTWPLALDETHPPATGSTRDTPGPKSRLAGRLLHARERPEHRRAQNRTRWRIWLAALPPIPPIAHEGRALVRIRRRQGAERSGALGPALDEALSSTAGSTLTRSRPERASGSRVTSSWPNRYAGVLLPGSNLSDETIFSNEANHADRQGNHISRTPSRTRTREEWSLPALRRVAWMPTGDDCS